MGSSLTPYPFGDEFQDIIVDSAVLHADGQPLSVSRGGIAFDPGEEWEDYAFPGKSIAVRGCREVTRMQPVLRGSLLMTGERQISAYRPGGTWEDHATITGARTFSPGEVRTALDPDVYLQQVLCVWKRQRGDYIAVQFDYAICRKWSIGSTDGDEGLIAVEIEAVSDSTLVTPYRVYTLPADTETDDLPEGGGDSDLPETPELGTIIHDLDATQEMADYADGASVTSATDRAGILNEHATVNAGLGQTAPIIDFDAFPGALPALVFDGVTDGLEITSQLTGGSFTTYLVMAGITAPAGDHGTPWNGNVFPQGKGLLFEADGDVGIYVDNSVPVPTYTAVADTWTKADAHIYAFVYNHEAGRMALFVDDDEVIAFEDANLLLTTLATAIRIGYYSGVFPLAFKLGRAVTWNKAHEGTTGDVVRAALRAYWGTP